MSWWQIDNEQQIFHPFTLWEDAKAGMYRRSSECEHLHIASAITILSNSLICNQSMRMVIECWRFASEHNMSNLKRNRRAWLGQSACCFTAGCPEYCTKTAWGMLPQAIQDKANGIAQVIISEWDNAILEVGKCQSANLT